MRRNQVSDQPSQNAVRLHATSVGFVDRVSASDRDLMRLPNFLVISPPKTGSSWLAANLAAHPRICSPSTKELRFFSWLHRWCDLDWYVSRFDQVGTTHRGEATPPYAVLPVSTIRQIRELIPDLKVIFLMRDPVERAWSHARHCRRYGEANFYPTIPSTTAPDSSVWQENFAHDWPCASGDYLGQLRRWMTVFPQQQIFVGFYESITVNPHQLLADILHFLEIEETPFGQLPIHNRINPGVPAELPQPLEDTLQAIYRDRTAQLCEFIKSEFGMVPPVEWQRTLRNGSRTSASCPMERVAAREFDDRYLSTVLEDVRRYEHRPGTFYPLYYPYLGYRTFIFEGKVCAFEPDLSFDFTQTKDRNHLDRLIANGRCLVADNLAQLRERIRQDVQVFRPHWRLRAIAERASRWIARHC